MLGNKSVEGHNQSLHVYQFLNVLRPKQEDLDRLVRKYFDSAVGADSNFSFVSPPHFVEPGVISLQCARPARLAEPAEILLDFKDRICLIRCAAPDDAFGLIHLVRTALFNRLKLMTLATRSPNDVIVELFAGRRTASAFSLAFKGDLKRMERESVSLDASLSDSELKEVELTWRNQVAFTLTPEVALDVVSPTVELQGALSSTYLPIFRDLILDLRMILQ